MFQSLKDSELKTRLAALVMVLCLIAIWLLTFLSTSYLRSDLETLLAEQQFSVASYVADDLEQSVQLRLDALSTISHEFDATLLNNPKKVFDLLAHRPLLKSLFGRGVIVISTRGQAIAACPTDTVIPKSLSFADAEYFKLVMQTGKPSVGKPKIGRVSHKPAIGFAAPILAKNGDIIGVLAGFSLLSDPTLFGTLEIAKAGKTGWIAVSAPAYELIVSSSDPTRILDRTAKPGVNKMFDKFAAGYEGSGISVNSKGIEALTSAKQIPSAGWFAQVVLPTIEAFAPIDNMVKRTYAIALSLSVIIAFLLWTAIRKLLRPLAETSRKIAEMASGKGLLTKIDVDRNDEIGALQKAFNLLAIARNKAEGLVQAQQQRISYLSHNLLTAQEEDRRRLALDIHDVVSPNIATIKIQLMLVRNELPTENKLLMAQLEDTQAILEDTEVGLRKICSDLRPSALDYNGLDAAIQEYGQQFSARTGISVLTSVHHATDRLSAETESILFRITQEALTNSAKHAKPKSISITWTLSPESGVLTIADDGSGFDTNGLTERRLGAGIGVLTMRERAEFIGGKFSMESCPENGTRITVEVVRDQLSVKQPA